MKTPTQAKIKSTGRNRGNGPNSRSFKKNKWYDIIKLDTPNAVCGYGFNILDDNGAKSFCLERECHHIDGDWELR